MYDLMNWLNAVAVCISQSFNAIVLLGSPDETVSARCHRQRHMRAWDIARRIFNTVYFWQEDHCADSYADDVSRAGWVLAAHRRANNRSEIPDES